MFEYPRLSRGNLILEDDLMRTSGWLRTVLLLAGAFALALALGCDGGGGDDGDGGGGGGSGKDTLVTPGEDTVDPGDDSIDCTPACGTSVCGPDGCGGECGTCEAGLDCNAGQCTEPPPDCDAVCAAKDCGWIEVCNCGECSGDLQCIGGTCKEVMSDCGAQGFTQVVTQAKLDLHPGGGFYMHFQTINQETTPFDVIVIEAETDAGSPTGPGVIDAAYSGFNEKGFWLYILKGWNGNGYDKLLIPAEGKINITSLTSEMGGTFTATLEGIRLVESTYNQADASLTPVAHGDTWCLDGVELNAPITQTLPDCVAEGTGQLLGDNVADFQLQNCNGDWINLHDSCKQQKAMWFVATAGW